MVASDPLFQLLISTEDDGAVMFFLWSNKVRPLIPAQDTVATWNRLFRIQGVGAKPKLQNIVRVFRRFCNVPFQGEPQRLVFELRDQQIRLKRCFGSQHGCFVVRMSLPVQANQMLDFPAQNQRAFFRAVRANYHYKALRRVPIEAISIAWEAGEN